MNLSLWYIKLISSLGSYHTVHSAQAHYPITLGNKLSVLLKRTQKSLPGQKIQMQKKYSQTHITAYQKYLSSESEVFVPQVAGIPVLHACQLYVTTPVLYTFNQYEKGTKSFRKDRIYDTISEDLFMLHGTVIQK